MTKKYLENQFKNYQDVVGTYVTPEMFGAKGDGVTDDTQAFEDAIASGKNVVCKHRATYFFNGNTIIDASAVNYCYLDLNESKLVNFHIKVGIKDGYKSGTGTAAPGWQNTATIKNGYIGSVNSITKMVNWETPIIQVGVNVYLEKLSIANAPYLMATVDAYRDVFVFKNINKSWDSSLWTSDILTLDAINVIKTDGTFARFNDADITAAISTGSGGGVAGDGWIFEGIGEWRGRENDDYAFVRFYRNQPIIIRNCIQSKFVIAKYSKASFIGCHFEAKYTMPEIYNLTDATTKSLAGMSGSTQILFDTCYFYNNYVLETDYENVTYMNCYFRKASDSTEGDKNIPLADTLKNRDYYDMKCKIINCCFTNSRNVDTDRFNLWKRLPKKTFNSHRKNHVSLTAIPATAADIASGSYVFPETGNYTYKTFTFSVGMDIANEEREWVRNITSLNSANVSTGNIARYEGGWRFEEYRTLPGGTIQRARFYCDPDDFGYKGYTYIYWALTDLGTYASLKIGIQKPDTTYTEFSFVLPWITVDAIPVYTVDGKLYEKNGVLDSEDFSEVPISGDLPYFNGSRVLQRFSTMPTANANNLGRIIMYTGETTSTFTHGYIYECVLDGSTYKWVQRDTQPRSAIEVRHKYNVQDYGVLPMADATKTTNALKALIELADAGSVLYFPAGVYNINDAITITKKLAFVGEESTTKTFKSTSIDSLPLSQIKVDSTFPANGTLFTKTSTSACTFTNLAFFCHGFYHQHENDATFSTLPYPFFVIDTPTVAGVNGIDASADGLFTINNCYFEGFSGYALKLKQHRFVDNCGFMRCNIGVEIVGTDCWISNCWFSGSNVGIHTPSTQGSTLLNVSDTWCDAMAGHFIHFENTGNSILLISNAWVDLLDKCAIYAPNSQLVNSMIEGRFSRCGMAYAGLEDADWTGEKSPLADTIYAYRYAGCEFNITVQRREIGIGNRPTAECPAHLIGMGTAEAPNNSYLIDSTIIAPDMSLNYIAPTQTMSVSHWPVFKAFFKRTNIHCRDGIFRTDNLFQYAYPIMLFRNATPVGKVLPARVNDFAFDSSTGNIYRSTDTTDNTKWELVSCKPDNAKLLIAKSDTLPTASASHLGETIMYTGATDAEKLLFRNAVYECVYYNNKYTWAIQLLSTEAWITLVSQCNDFADFKAFFANL